METSDLSDKQSFMLGCSGGGFSYLGKNFLLLVDKVTNMGIANTILLNE